MKNKKKVTTIILWTARISGTLVLAFLLLFLGAAVIGTITGGPDGLTGFKSTNEVITFIFFPIGTMIGLALALKWEGLGGIINVGSLIALMLMRVDLASDYIFVGLAIPGLLYIVYWLMTRSSESVS